MEESWSVPRAFPCASRVLRETCIRMENPRLKGFGVARRSTIDRKVPIIFCRQVEKPKASIFMKVQPRPWEKPVGNYWFREKPWIFRASSETSVYPRVLKSLKKMTADKSNPSSRYVCTDFREIKTVDGDVSVMRCCNYTIENHMNIRHRWRRGTWWMPINQWQGH